MSSYNQHNNLIQKYEFNTERASVNTFESGDSCGTPRLVIEQEIPAISVHPSLNSMSLIKQKRLIVCADKQSPYEGGDSCLVHCVAMNESYAKQIGVDFKFVLLKETLEKRHPSWEKIRVVAKFVQEYDEILWFNSDAFVANRSVNAFDYIKTAPESEWKRDASIKPVIFTLSNKPWGSDMACTGIFLLDCSNKWTAVEVLNEWWSNVPDKRYEQEHPWEQSVWNNAWKNTPKASYLRVADVWSMSEKAEKAEKEEKLVFVHATHMYKNAHLPLVKKYMYKQSNPSRAKKLGIIVRQQNYYSNGAGQNCIFLMQSFEALGYDVDLLVYWKKENPQHVSDTYPIAYKDIAAANYKEYEAILFGAQVPTTSDMERMKACGVRRIMFNPCNVVDAFHAEHFIYVCRSTPLPLFEMGFKDIADEIWLTDNHRESSLTYLEVMNKNKIPVHCVPLTWSPLFLKDATGNVSIQKLHTGKQLDIVIMEPNMSYCKNGWVPLVACEKIYLENPELIHNVYFFNSPESNKTAMGMIETLDLWKSKKIRIMKRIPITDILRFFSDPVSHGDHLVVFISHQINVPLNYAYFDALYAGFPFVHNSPVLKERGVGYYYSNLGEAAIAIRSAAIMFDLEASLKRAHAMLANQDPYSEVCLKVFRELLVKPSLPLTELTAPTSSRKFKVDLFHLGDFCEPGIIIDDILNIRQKQLFMLGHYNFNDIARFLHENNYHSIYDRDSLRINAANQVYHDKFKFVFNHDYKLENGSIVNYEFIKDRFRIKIKNLEDMLRSDTLTIFITFTTNIDSLKVIDMLKWFAVHKKEFHIIIFSNKPYTTTYEDARVSFVNLKRSYEQWFQMNSELKTELYKEIYAKFIGVVATLEIKHDFPSVFSETHYGKHLYTNIETPLVISYDNKPNEQTQFFCKTLTDNKWDYEIIGEGEVWEKLQFSKRVMAYYNFIQHLPDEKIVILSDARDVVCVRSPKAFLDGFRSFGKDLVFSMELSCESKIDLPSGYVPSGTNPLHNYWSYYKRSPPMRRYLNAGLMVGTVRALKICLLWVHDAMKTSAFPECDQLSFAHYMDTFPDRVAADTEALLLHSTNFGLNAGILKIHVQKQDSPTFAELFGRGAFFLHVPGSGGNNGQRVVYDQVCLIIDSGVCDSLLREPYGYAEPAWNEVF